MTILMAILTVLCVLVLARWLVAGRPATPGHVQLMPDGSVPDFDRTTAPAPTSAPAESPAPTDDAPTDDAPAPEGDGVDATDVVRSGTSVDPAHEDAKDAADGEVDTEDPDAADAEEGPRSDDAGATEVDTDDEDAPATEVDTDDEDTAGADDVEQRA